MKLPQNLVPARSNRRSVLIFKRYDRGSWAMETYKAGRSQSLPGDSVVSQSVKAILGTDWLGLKSGLSERSSQLQHSSRVGCNSDTGIFHDA